MSVCPFHLAIFAHDLSLAREFYGGLLRCPEGRSSDKWIDFNLWGHQLVVHLVPDMDMPEAARNIVDGHHVAVPHFGIVLSMDDWKALADCLRRANIKFGIEPTIRFKGQPGEQATMFFRDPFGNAIEMKAFQDGGQLFSTEHPSTSESDS